MELRRLWLLIRHRKILVALLVTAAVAAGYAATARTAQYQAVSVLFVGVSEQNPYGVFSADLQTGQQQLATTFATMIPSLNVAESAVEASGAPRSAGQVVSEMKAGVVPGTTLIHVIVTDRDPVVAQTLANAVAQVFVNQLAKIDPVTTNTSGGAIAPKAPASISQQAFLPAVPISDGLRRNLILSGTFGLVAALGLVLLLDYLDVSVRTPDELERRVGLPVLGIIPLYPQLTDRDFVAPPKAADRETAFASKIDG
ncbi:MAG: YveK family protein [Acidimicrobiales bacterium]